MTRKALSGYQAGFEDAVEQMAAFLANLKGQANVCVYCGEPFAIGSGGGRRRDAMYCCNAHRVADQRRKARHALPAMPNPPILP